jgi:hypothetical protein
VSSALAITAIIAMAGLVLDGGSAFAQRRIQAERRGPGGLAGANAYADTTGAREVRRSAAIAAAHASALQNSYQDGVDSATITVGVTLRVFRRDRQVGIGDAHQEQLRASFQQETWAVSVTASAWWA